jgi:hypothetical protein
VLEAHQAPAEPQSCCAAYRVFRHYVQWSSPNLDSVVWSQLSTSRGSIASAKTGGCVIRKSEYEVSLSWCRGCWWSAPQRVQFSMRRCVRLFWVARSCSRLPGGRGGGGGALPRGACPRPRPTDPLRMSRIGSSKVLVHTICHNELCIISYLHKSSKI